jgi:hypothetical protein
LVSSFPVDSTAQAETFNTFTHSYSNVCITWRIYRNKRSIAVLYTTCKSIFGFCTMALSCVAYSLLVRERLSDMGRMSGDENIKASGQYLKKQVNIVHWTKARLG